MEFLETEQQLRSRIMEDFWRKRFYAASQEEAAWAVSLWSTPDELLSSLGGHLSRPNVECIPVIEDEELVRRLEELEPLFTLLRKEWHEHGQEAARQLIENKRLLRSKEKGYHPERLALMISEMERFVQQDSMAWLLSKDMEFFTRTKIDTCLSKRSKADPPDHPFFDFFDRFFPLHREMTRCRKIAVLLAGRDFLRVELARRKQELAQLYYDDLLTLLDTALDEPGGRQLAKSISRRFPAVMVDEFQDTDPLQYRIFSRIYAADPEAALFLIGDPKQAIYGFRGADIFTYIQARRQTPPEKRFTMTTNYRSTTPMVSSVNRLFDRDNPFFFDRQAIGFIPVQASDLADKKTLLLQGRQPQPLTCLLLREPANRKTLTKKDAKKQAAEYSANEIAGLMAAGMAGEAFIDNRPLGGGDIAVLVRTHDEAEIIRQTLAGLSISSVYISRESVFAGPEAGQLVTMLTGLLNLSDPALVRTALATDLFGYTALQLEQLRHEELRWEQIMAALNDYLTLWQQKGFIPMFQRLLAEQQLVSRLQAEPSGERRLTNYLHLAELLQTASRVQSGPDGLLRWLTDQVQAPEEQADSQQLRLESDENLVKIVTIHKAKGLEYPVVFLPFLWSARTCQKDEPFAFHRPDDPDTLYIDLGSGKDENFQLAENERLAGDLRLLYVAMTRARYCCYFCWGRISKMEDSALCYLLHGRTVPDVETMTEDLVQLAGSDNGLAVKHFPEQFVSPGLKTDDRRDLLQAAQFTGHIDTGWQITSYSRLTAQYDQQPERPDYDRQAAGESQAQARDVFGFPRGAAAGTCLHAILELISFTDPEKYEQIVRAQLERVGIEKSWLEVVIPWLRAIAKTELEPGFSLACLQDRDRINEMSFYFPLQSMELDRFNQALQDFSIPSLPEQRVVLQGLMVGFIDLVYRHDNRYYVADYKSNYLGNSPADYVGRNLQAAMLEHRYDLQYLIYTLALHRFLAGRIRGYDYDVHFGGVRYLFLRGMNPENKPGTGVFSSRPPFALIDRLDKCCAGQEGRRCKAF